jgi:hypothetical protein
MVWFGSQLINCSELMVRFINLWFGYFRFGLAVRFSLWFSMNSPSTMDNIDDTRVKLMI